MTPSAFSARRRNFSSIVRERAYTSVARDIYVAGRERIPFSMERVVRGWGRRRKKNNATKDPANYAGLRDVVRERDRERKGL